VLLATVAAVIAAAMLVWYLVYRPPVDPPTKVLLLFAFGVLPLASTMIGGVATFQHTTHRAFCGSCHVMTPYTSDSANPASTTLAARHARNELFGDRNCYECHRDYGMFSTVVTKWGGMRHVWEYYTHFRTVPVDDFLSEVHLYRPFVNASCMRCHSTAVRGWDAVDDHRALRAPIRSGEVSCVSAGCHGPAHPFSKPEEERR
jgi:cytochrome c-type protein NapC